MNRHLVRRVVTGNGADGKGAVFSDERLDLNQSGVCTIWGSDIPPYLSTDGSMPSHSELIPPLGGSRVVLFVLPPMQEQDVPGDGPLEMRDTVDSIVVLSGEAYVQHGEGSEVRLVAGDVLVQNGTLHTWRNKSNAPMVGVSFIVGASAKGNGE
jgi:hypothetical protein